MSKQLPFLVFATLAVSAGSSLANAPYVTLYYSDPEGTVLLRDVVVTQEAVGSYYCALGWFGTDGYAGLQRTPGNRGVDGKTFYKHLHFSLWDTPDKKPIPMIWKRPEVIVDGFGGEGEGVKSLWPFDWQVGSRYTIALKVWDSGPAQTAWGMWFRDNDHEKWYRTATWGYPAAGVKIGAGTYSFIEDYLGNNLQRGMQVGPSWKLDTRGQWSAIRKATVRERDGLIPWNVKLADGKFDMLSGGATAPGLVNGTALTADLPAAPTLLPQVPRATARYADGALITGWSVDSSKSPPFAYSLTLSKGTETVRTWGKTDPSALADTLRGLNLADGTYTVRLSLTDIFEGKSQAEAGFSVGTAGLKAGRAPGAAAKRAGFAIGPRRVDAQGRALPERGR
jgi:hypothetical protein